MTASASSVVATPSLDLNLDAADATPLRHHQPGRRGFVAKFHPALSAASSQSFDDGAAAADRLDARRPGAEIIDRRDRTRRRGPAAIRWSRSHCPPASGNNPGSANPPEALPHVVFKTGRDPVRRVQPHVGRAPAGVAAGFGFARFFQHRDVDAQAAVARLLGRRKRRGKTGRSVSDNDQLLRDFASSGIRGVESQAFR